jgi:S1-C subfamily serine protease
MKLAALLALVLTGCGCTSLPFGETHDTTHRLEMVGGICSGTAISDHELRTANHCIDLGGALQLVDGWDAHVVSMSANKARDIIDITLAGHPFKHWAQLGPRPKQGDRIRWWGNPEGEADVYREGYVAKVTDEMIVVDATICHGDSGSGLFNESGQLVGVVSAMSDLSGCTFMLAHS